ncbi:MAG TPA: hypothetical protein VK444_03070 [Methanobacteriaceae archaeon]|nr:hypothetical protein [Methanobacteriaceae archaeon]
MKTLALILLVVLIVGSVAISGCIQGENETDGVGNIKITDNQSSEDSNDSVHPSVYNMTNTSK